jgi:hypothetical protein
MQAAIDERADETTATERKTPKPRTSAEDTKAEDERLGAPHLAKRSNQSDGTHNAERNLVVRKPLEDLQLVKK